MSCPTGLSIRAMRLFCICCILFVAGAAAQDTLRAEAVAPQTVASPQPSPPLEAPSAESESPAAEAAEEAVESEPPPPSALPTIPQAAPAPIPVADGSDGLPNLNIYLPEGEFDIRVRRLIRNVLFEAQISYNFVDGDISTFLRYKYYAKNLTYKIGVFDTLEFESIDDFSGDFDRVRGALLQFAYPADYDSRYSVLFQADRLLFGDVDNPDNTNNNFYAKVGYQFGTPFDERLNAIVGETRGRITPVLTAYRDLGRQRLGIAAAVTQSLGGDYSYTRAEAEIVKRFDLRRSQFLVSRLHGGSFLALERRPEIGDPGDDDLLDQPTHLFSVPRYEYFRLGGRDALKALDSDSRGTEEVHLSNEFFVPIFRERETPTGPLSWTNLYGIVYAGAGSVGFRGDEAVERAGYRFGDLVVDAGLGFEASVEYRDTEVILSLIYAQTVRSPQSLESREIRFAARVVR
jgi:hypothetical protein